MISSLMINLRSAARSLGLLKVAYRVLNAKEIAYRNKLRKTFKREKPDFIPIGNDQVSGKLIALDEDQYAENYGVREPHVFSAIVDLLTPGDVVWDIGANAGYFSVIMAQRVKPNGRIVAFEPEPRIREVLIKNIELNNLDNVSILPVALGDKSSVMNILSSKAASSGAHRLAYSGADTADGTQAIEIEVTTGDQIIAQNTAPSPTVLKIDVEGFEEEVIKGLSAALGNHKLRAVICEVHFALLEERGQRLAPKRIADRLRELGFTQQDWPDASHLLAVRK